MTARAISGVSRIARYGVAGCIVSVLFSGGLIGLVQFGPGIGPVLATIVMFWIIQPVGYLTHRLISFPEPNPPPRSWLRFVVTNLGALAASTGGMALVTDVLHASYLWGIALNWALIPVTNFLIYLSWVFRPGREFVKGGV